MEAGFLTSFPTHWPTSLLLSFFSYTHKHTVALISSSPFSRLVQKAELTRLSQTFLNVPQLHWIVVEDSPHKTPLVTDLLVKSGLTHTHLHMPTAKDRKLQEVGSDMAAVWHQMRPH